MARIQRKLILLVAALFLVCSLHTPAMAGNERTYSEEDDSLILLDIAVARPLGVATIVAGTALFMVWLPFSLPSGSVKDSWEKLVLKPVDYTFKRPLGSL